MRFKACSIEGCGGNADTTRGGAKGWCPRHYIRFRKFGDPLAGGPHKVRGGTVCTVSDCEKRAASHGLCQMHAARKKTHGDPSIVTPKNRKKIQWIEDNASHCGDECLIWPFGVGDQGRGTVMFNKVKNFSAPRAMCWVAHGEPPTSGHQAAHSCGNGHIGCMNPCHLSWKTRKENEADKILHGTIRRGQKINTAKLSSEDVIKIRSMIGRVKVGVITKMFGITRGHVYDIRDRKSWAWLEDRPND